MISIGNNFMSVGSRRARIYPSKHPRYAWVLRLCDGASKFFQSEELAAAWCNKNKVILKPASVRSNRPHYKSVTAGYIYVIQGGGLVKVGYTTKEPDERVKSLQVGSPVELDLVYRESFEDVVRLERAVHDELFQLGFWERGEWFNCEPDEVTELIIMLKNEGFT